ncbi:hypothetical protein D9757_004733 [Collybiopsis confluens]|uniref:Protein kinase domain-containing protein n=1 Tax=Collybiopsis confluens TaxID=2823264 RepID=A0A8H5CQN9_9AGAR|nr:hypothetical protein D9757_014062 [Collybiopsis confluens]KAF5388501.1 hypothetical protein D9757_004733 [Collybiopsis confluens]
MTWRKSTGFTSSYKYLNHYRLLNTTTLESLEEVARKYFHFVGGNLHFFKLMEPIEVPSTRDIQAKCEATWKMLVSLVIVWTPPLDYTSVSGRSLTAIAEHPDAQETIARKAQGKPPPSTGAKSTELLSTQDMHHLDAAYNHQPPELIPPPLAIYDPVFAKFRHEMVTPTETLLFTEDKFDCTSRFIDASLRHYPNEHARQQALEAFPILDGEYWQTKKILTNASTVEPDGGSFGLKNGDGDGGCDPSDQAQCGYIKIVSSLQYQPIRLVSCRPAFLVGLSGHTLAIWGAVFADRFFFERLSLISESALHLSDPASYYYDHIYLKPPIHPPNARYWYSTLSTGYTPLRLLRPFSEDVVKFAYHYGAAGHRLLAKAGFAPRLYHCAFDETIGMWVVVMDYVSGRVCHGKLIEGQRLSIKTAIGLLHAEDLVFGDLREPNVIITEPKNSVCLVDFEWCGLCRDIQEGGNVIPRLGLAVDPHSWGSNLSADVAEADDELHKPEEKVKGIEHDGNAWSKRGVTNLGFL